MVAKYATWKELKSMMAAVKRKKCNFGHVEFDVEEVVLTHDFKIRHVNKTSSLGGTKGAPRETQVIKAGTYYHVTIEYTHR